MIGGMQPGITGIGLVEIYDLHQSSDRAANISTRGTVLSGDGVMIVGCIIGGNDRKELVVRALGPSLRDRGVPDAVGNPNLQLFDSNGVLAAQNDDWAQNADAAAIQAVGLAPESPRNRLFWSRSHPVRTRRSKVRRPRFRDRLDRNLRPEPVADSRGIDLVQPTLDA